MKLARHEPESQALIRELRRRPDRVSNAVVRVEVIRALRRVEATSEQFRLASSALGRVMTIACEGEVIERAAAFEVPALRALDAIHLASALSLGADLDAFVVYDRRLADAARGLGLPVISPS